VNVTVYINLQTGDTKVTIPDRHVGGGRLAFDLSLLDALQLHDALTVAFDGINGKRN